MNIARRTFLIVGATLVGIAALAYFVSEIIFLDSFRKLETERSRTNIERVVSALLDEVSALDLLLGDWARWDDAYEFVAAPEANQRFVEANLVDETFTDTNLNLILLFNTEGRLVKGRMFDLERKQEIPFPQVLLAETAPGSLLLTHRALGSSVKGILNLPGLPITLIASRPILTSENQGPIRGTLIMGRPLAPELVEKLAMITRVELEMFSMDDPSAPPDLKLAIRKLGAGAKFNERLLDENRVAACTVIEDIHGRPALMAQVTTDRDIFRRGRASIIYFQLWMMGMALGAGILSALILRHLVLAPVSRLIRNVTRIGNGGVLAARVPVKGRDELSQLAVSINRMLEALEKTQEALRENEERYRAVVEDQTELICRFRPDGTITFVNKAFCNYFGEKREEVIGVSLAEVVRAEDREAFWKNLASLRPQEPVSAHEYRIIGSSGQARIFRCVHRAIFNPGGAVEEYQCVGADVTEQKRVEGELIRTQKLESIGTLAGGIAHDFNNFLASILGNVSLARRLEPGGKISELLAEMETAVLNARDLTKQLLTFSRGGAPIMKTVGLSGLIHNTARLALSGSQCRSEISLPDDLRPVEADESQLNQVVNNLVINAAQAMPHGGTVGIRGENVALKEGQALKLPAGDYVKISIRDQGVGIPMENLTRIFDPYFTTKPQGVGLGLTTSYSIVKNHRGAISVESAPGLGSTFSIYLPASHRGSITQDREGKKPVSGSGRILLMDDDQMVREVAKKMIEHLGYEVVAADNGQVLLDEYRRARQAGKPYDAVIIDLTVPGQLGGKEAIALLLDLDPRAKAIVSSGYSNDPIMSEHHRYGFKGVIAKPYELDELSQVLAGVISDKAPKAASGRNQV